LEFQLLFDSTLLRNEIYQSVNALFLAVQQQQFTTATTTSSSTTTQQRER
jgi:hypothetical protein